jgi:hypothetical protein
MQIANRRLQLKAAELDALGKQQLKETYSMVMMRKSRFLHNSQLFGKNWAFLMQNPDAESGKAHKAPCSRRCCHHHRR